MQDYSAVGGFASNCWRPPLRGAALSCFAPSRVPRLGIGRIPKHWPHVAILVRGVSHYCSEPALALLEALRCDYIIG